MSVGNENNTWQASNVIRKDNMAVKLVYHLIYGEKK